MIGLILRRRANLFLAAFRQHHVLKLDITVNNVFVVAFLREHETGTVWSREEGRVGEA